MNWKTYTFGEIKSKLGRVSEKRIKEMIADGVFGDSQGSEVPGEVLLAEDAIEVYLNTLEREKKQHKKAKQQEKDRNKPKPTLDTHFKYWKHQPSEYRIVAKIAFQNALTTPSMMEGIAKCKGDVEVKAYLKMKYEEFYAKVQWGHTWKAKKRAWNHVRQREFFESALDMKTQVKLLFNEQEQEYFWQELSGYALIYGLANPMKKDLIKLIIIESIYSQRKRGSLLMQADDVVDKALINDVTASQERLIKLMQTLNTVHYKIPMPVMVGDDLPKDDWNPTGAGEDIN